MGASKKNVRGGGGGGKRSANNHFFLNILNNRNIRIQVLCVVVALNACIIAHCDIIYMCFL